MTFHRSLTLVLTAALSYAAPSLARADFEAWQQVEMRVPIVSTPTPTFPRLSLRVYGEGREAGRFGGLYDSYLRVGPLFWVAPFLFIGVHGTLEGTRTAGGCAEGAPATCGTYVFEFRTELEPNFFGRLGPFTFNDRNRLEFRWRESGMRYRYRNQLRVNLQPPRWRVYPFIMDEVLFDFSDGFNQNRATAGVAVDIRPGTRLDIGYTFRSRQTPATGGQPAAWAHDHIMLLTFVVDLAVAPPAPPASTPPAPAPPAPTPPAPTPEPAPR